MEFSSYVSLPEGSKLKSWIEGKVFIVMSELIGENRLVGQFLGKYCKDTSYQNKSTAGFFVIFCVGKMKLHTDMAFSIADYRYRKKGVFFTW